MLFFKNNASLESRELFHSTPTPPNSSSFSAFFIFQISPSRRNFARGFATFVSNNSSFYLNLVGGERCGTAEPPKKKNRGFDRRIANRRKRVRFPPIHSRELTRKL